MASYGVAPRLGSHSQASGRQPVIGRSDLISLSDDDGVWVALRSALALLNAPECEVSALVTPARAFGAALC